MAMVADAADVHVTTLFTHFTSKSDLLSALSEPAIKNLEETVCENIGKLPFFTFMRKIQLEFAQGLKRGGKQAISDALFWRNHFELVPAWINFERKQIEMFARYLEADFPVSALQARLVAGMIVSANIFSFDEWLENPLGVSLIKSSEANLVQVEKIVNKSFLG